MAWVLQQVQTQRHKAKQESGTHSTEKTCISKLRGYITFYYAGMCHGLSRKTLHYLCIYIHAYAYTYTYTLTYTYTYTYTYT